MHGGKYEWDGRAPSTLLGLCRGDTSSLLVVADQGANARGRCCVGTTLIPPTVGKHSNGRVYSGISQDACCYFSECQSDSLSLQRRSLPFRTRVTCLARAQSGDGSCYPR